MLIDTNTYIGPWPFFPVEELSTRKFASQLSENGIGHAFVSHFGAVFAPDPMVANRQLIKQTRSRPWLDPVPIINLNLGTWHDQIVECLDSAPIRAVKLLPNYHNYKLGASRLDAFLDAIQANRLRLIINVRLNDERGQYFALKIKGVHIDSLEAFLTRFPESHPLITGLYRPELMELAGRCDNFSADIAFCEWRNTVADLLTVIPGDRLMLGTCTPLLATRAQVDKLRLSGVPARIRNRIAAMNAKRFFRL